MATQKIQAEKATIEKIKKLFTYRRITHVLKESGLDKDKDFVANIINVQYQIYMLDTYLESRWDLDKVEIKKLWQGIYASLESMGLNKKTMNGLVEEIKEYERIERNTRKDKWPSKVSFQDFYQTKSCDVRLIRHLIYLAKPELSNSWKEKAWRYYDLITEINDDIADMQEDLPTYNGNRFLISVLRNGMDKTVKQYHEYLEKITRKAESYFAEKGAYGKNKLLAGWTLDRSLQTLKLLEAQPKAKILDKLSSALLLQKMK